MVNTLRTQTTCVSNMPSDQMLNTFRICPAMCPQCAQWPNVEHILNVYGHVSPIYPVVTELGTFGMIAKICSQCTQLGTLWTHSKYIVQCELHVIAGQTLIAFWMYLVMWPKYIQMRLPNMFRKNWWTHGIICKHLEHSPKNRTCSKNILNVITEHFWITFLGKF